MPQACYVFDIDGTVCDVAHRLHYILEKPDGDVDWDAFHAACVDDMPIKPVIDLCRRLGRTMPIVFCTARNDTVRQQTEQWLTNNVLVPDALYMRKDGDRRPDWIVKQELLAEIQKDGWMPVMAFEDRSRVVNMWRSNGIPCLQVQEGEY